VPVHDSPVVQSNVGRVELASYKPRRVVKSMAIMRPWATEGRDEPDTEPTPGAPNSLNIVRRHRRRVPEHNSQKRANIDTQLKGWRAN
jgi:hypothetical protein